MTTLADTYLAKLGVSKMKTYPPVPLTIFLSKEQLEIWTQLNQLDKDIQASTSGLQGLQGLGLPGTNQNMVVTSPANGLFINPQSFAVNQHPALSSMGFPAASSIGFQNAAVNNTTVTASPRKRFKVKKPKHKYNMPQPMVRRTYRSRKVVPIEMRIRV